ncbi:hypothetical protein ACM66B_003958 [Microbotryomycetes sp. NB124-2]
MSYQPPPSGQYGAGAPPPTQWGSGGGQAQSYAYQQQQGNPAYPQQQQPYGAQAPYQAQYGQAPPQQAAYPGAPPQQQPHYGQTPPPQPAYGQAPPAQGQYGAPPSGAGYQPQYNAAPPGGQQYQQGPPQPHYAQQQPPHNGGYGQQQPQYAGGYPQQPVGYGQPPMQPGYGAPMAAQVIPRTYLGSPLHPSENPLLPPHEQVRDSQPVDGYNATKDVEVIKKACKGFGTDEAKINGVLVPMPAVRLPVLRYTYKSKEGKDLEKLLEKELKGNHERVIMNLLRGPLGADLHNIFEACDGLGTHEDMLTELLIGRAPLALDLLKAAFQKQYNKSLEKTVLDELSFKTKSAMQVALLGDWHDMPNGGRSPEFENGVQPGAFGAPPVNHQMIQDDLVILGRAIRPMVPELDQQPVSSVIFARSPVHLNALQQAYLQSKRAPLTRHIKQMVDGHLKDMYLLALNGSKKDTTGIWRDAKMLNKAMVGLGTRDELLTIRLIRAHWDKHRFNQVKAAYKQKTGKELANSVMKETSGDYRDALMSLINAT